MLDTTTRTAAIARLRELLGDRLSTALAVRTQHADDPTWHDARPADAVAFPESEQEVAAIVRICAAHQLPVIPYGVGTSLEGHIAAPEGGVCIDLSRLNRVIAVNAQDMDCVVEPGVTRRQLNSHLRDTGLFFPVDPGADATIGGMAATRASGTNAVRFGTMAENVRSMRVVLASGEIIDTARRARKSAAGYDLTRLFIGSEGTLGVFTRLTLKLSPIPEAVIAGVLAFPSVRAACEAVIATIQSALPVARIELLDAETIATLNTYSKLAMPERPTLFIEFHGSPAGIGEQREAFMALAGEFGAEALQWAGKPEERHRLWRA
ncbi:MAG TPA: FAD-binding protein, partial [Thermopetrobacter sp.]|nr:FAD-binding protein [Thermopetrobacter sp.]